MRVVKLTVVVPKPSSSSKVLQRVLKMPIIEDFWPKTIVINIKPTDNLKYQLVEVQLT